MIVLTKMRAPMSNKGQRTPSLITPLSVDDEFDDVEKMSSSMSSNEFDDLNEISLSVPMLSNELLKISRIFHIDGMTFYDGRTA